MQPSGCDNSYLRWIARLSFLTILVCACRGALSHSFYVFERRQAKEPPIFSAKLRWALIADTIGGRGGVEPFDEHQPPRFVQP